jgi:hypothetical protein
MLHGAKGEHEEALDYLVRTNADVLHMEDRALHTRYQILEAAEMLYEHTGHDGYRRFLLDLARRNTVIDPMQSWAHAFVAAHSEDPNERQLARARALHLDPHSNRALQASAAEIDAARRLLERGNPFADANEATL